MSTVAAGVRSDCDAFLEKFKERETLRYEKFAQVWREMDFSFIFYGKETEAEVHEFTEEIFMIAKTMWLSRTDIQERVCGFYLLYAFYMKQPLKSVVKIRMTPSEWNECTEFVSSVLQDQHWDIYFVFRRLVVEQHGFQFVHLPQEISHKVQAHEQESEGERKLTAETDLLRNYVELGSIEQIASINDRYEAMKKDLMKTSFIDQPMSLQMTEPEVVNKIVKLCSSDSAVSETTVVTDKDKPDVEEEEKREEEDIGTRRLRLKNRQFASVTGSTKQAPQ